MRAFNCLAAMFLLVMSSTNSALAIDTFLPPDDTVTKADIAKEKSTYKKCRKTYSIECAFFMGMKHDYNGSIKQYSKLIEKEQNPNLRGFYFFQNALAKTRLNDFQGAMSDINEAISLNRDSGTSYAVRAGLKAELLDYQGAISDLSQAINLTNSKTELDNTELKSMFEERADYQMKIQNFQSASEDYSSAIKYASKIRDIPFSASAFQLYLKSGDAKLAMKDYKEAISDYTKEIEIYPDSPMAYHNRGLAKEALGMSGRDDFIQGKNILKKYP